MGELVMKEILDFIYPGQQNFQPSIVPKKWKKKWMRQTFQILRVDKFEDYYSELIMKLVLNFISPTPKHRYFLKLMESWIKDKTTFGNMANRLLHSELAKATFENMK